MNVYQIDVAVMATLYIKADSAAEAHSKATAAAQDATLEISSASGDIEVTGRMFDDPNLPEVSFSPAMSVGALCDGMPDLCEENVPDLPKA